MAYKNKVLINNLTGQDILFLQTAKDTNGELLEMETTYRSNSTEPPLHYHPFQSEDFKVLSGEVTVKINGEQRKLTQGDTLHINPNESHAMWNTSGSRAVVLWKVQPALNTEHLFETMNGLIKDGKTNSKGMPGFLQIALTVNKFSSVFRLSKPAFIIQKILFTLLTPFAWLAGYRAVYKKYID